MLTMGFDENVIASGMMSTVFNPDGDEKKYRVLVDRDGNIVSQTPEPTDEESTEEKPIVGEPEVQSKEEYESDPNFSKIDDKLRAENDLDGFDVVSVSKQVVNGMIYVIIYRNPDGEERTYEVFVNPDGQIMVKNVHGKDDPAQGTEKPDDGKDAPPIIPNLIPIYVLSKVSPI